ncbi:MAG TPA: hypothetical protein VFG83_04330 [Kofleriaceae bacterium]|nr:hypothetical protein [Kofleriaceae bacterium]
MEKSSLAILCGLLVLCCAPPAFADEPSRRDVARAKAYEQKAHDYDQMGDYARAAENYQLAYDLSKEPKLVFRVAELYRAMGKNDRALEAFQVYLSVAPDGPAAATAKQNIEAIEAERRAVEAAKKALEKERTRREARSKIDTSQPTSAPASHAIASTSTPPVTAASVPPSDEEPARPGHIYKLAGLGTGAAGVALASVGIYFAVRAHSIKSDLDAVAVWGPKQEDQFDEWSAARRNGFIFGGVGVAAIVGGGVLYYLGMRKDAEQSGGFREWCG